jgi:hypothetical protein
MDRIVFRVGGVDIGPVAEAELDGCGGFGCASWVLVGVAGPRSRSRNGGGSRSWFGNRDSDARRGLGRQSG